MDDGPEEEPLPVKPGSLHAGTTSINKRLKSGGLIFQVPEGGKRCKVDLSFH